MSKRRTLPGMPGNLGPIVITGALVLIVIAAIAFPRFRNSLSPRPPTPNVSEESTTSAQATPQVFRYFIEQPGSLDPALAADAYASIVIAQIFSPLVGLTSDLEPIPQLAESWTISRDGLVYVFSLHRGVRFHNGREVDADDVVYSLTRLFQKPYLTEGLAAGYLDAIAGVPEFIAGKAAAIRGIRALDRYRIEIRLSRPYSALLSALALDQAAVVPRDLMEAKGSAAFSEHPVGCGPFRVAYRKGNDLIVLASNSDYFKGRPAIDSVVFYSPVEDVENEAANALVRGEAAMATLPVNRLEEIKSRPDIRVIRWQDLSLSFIGMNVTAPPLDNEAVRQAVALAMDRDAMLKRWPDGKVLSQGVLPPGLPGYSPEPRTHAHDPEAARRLLAQAGYGPSHPLPTLTLWKSAGSQSSRQVDTVMVRSLAAGGIQVRIKYVPWAELERAITAKTAPMFGLAWIADIPDPDSFLRLLFYSKSATNYFRFSDRSVDSLLDLAQRTADPATRSAAYRVVEKTVVKRAPLVPLFHPSTFVGLRDDVSGFEVNPLGISTIALEKLRLGKPKRFHDARQARH